eukprot:CAMPEP_0204506288 /NCGR_PEP_ID=MMETSP0471-20130131/109171_1 /ASSEMBLY_ACC=CAM_ASM_000602 /TAXON_ID=2969 /ORGANISM="Oxyrrhis marina" /LENGTH=197 /DNA_ID=CAMNT_0051511283 /DNA_START=64 /DNA_END=658 /DNA_ORIENTATION=+
MRVAAFVTVAAAKTIKLTWTDCGDTSTHGKITGLTTNPDPPVLGQKTAITSTGTVDEDVKSGTYTVEVKAPVVGKILTHSDTVCGDSSFDIKVLGVNIGSITAGGGEDPDPLYTVCGDSSFDIKVLGVNIGSITVHGLTCPAAKGDLSLNIDMQLNDNLPAGIGSATVAMTAVDDQSGKLLCLNMNAEIQKAEDVVV